MPLDNSGTKMVLNRYGNLITTKDRTSWMWIYDYDLGGFYLGGALHISLHIRARGG